MKLDKKNYSKVRASTSYSDESLPAPLVISSTTLLSPFIFTGELRSSPLGTKERR